MSMAKLTVRHICTESAGQADLERFAHTLHLNLSHSYPSYSPAWSGNKPGGRAKVDGCAEGDWEALWERHCQAWRRGRRWDRKAEPGLKKCPASTSHKLPVLYLRKKYFANDVLSKDIFILAEIKLSKITQILFPGRYAGLVKQTAGRAF